MKHKAIKEKILNDLNQINETDPEKDPKQIMKEISEKYNVPSNVVEQTMAEWSAA